MFRKLRKKQAGFTLVEVIVVAVIVAVLALVAVQLYLGYVRESRKNTAENLAASAASYLHSIVNSVSTSQAEGNVNPLATGATWTDTLSAGNVVSFTCPANAYVTFNTGDGTVHAAVGPGTDTVGSAGTYKYK